MLLLVVILQYYLITDFPIVNRKSFFLMTTPLFYVIITNMELNETYFISPISVKEATSLSPQSLAFVGDAVYTLYVRAKVTESTTAKSNSLHQKTALRVKASAQSHTIERIMGILTEEELYIYKRGRNTKTVSTAKNSSVIDYRKATGFETLLGFLYLTGNNERLLTILKASEEN